MHPGRAGAALVTSGLLPVRVQVKWSSDRSAGCYLNLPLMSLCGTGAFPEGLNLVRNPQNQWWEMQVAILGTPGGCRTRVNLCHGSFMLEQCSCVLLFEVCSLSVMSKSLAVRDKIERD